MVINPWMAVSWDVEIMNHDGKWLTVLTDGILVLKIVSIVHCFDRGFLWYLGYLVKHIFICVIFI